MSDVTPEADPRKLAEEARDRVRFEEDALDLADRITRDETEHRHHLHMIERMLRDGYSEREICEALPGGRASRGNGLGSLGALLGWVRARFGS